MAAQSEESGRIQFAEGVQSKSEKHTAMAGADGLSERVSSQDLDDLDHEEKARKIAEEDLTQKRKQVRPSTLSPVAIMELTASPPGIHRLPPPLALLPVRRHHLRRHRHLPPLRLLLNLHLPTLVGRPRRRPLHHHLGPDPHRHHQIHLHRPPRRRRRPGRHLCALLAPRPLHQYHQGLPPGPHHRLARPSRHQRPRSCLARRPRLPRALSSRPVRAQGHRRAGRQSGPC